MLFPARSNRLIAPRKSLFRTVRQGTASAVPQSAFLQPALAAEAATREYELKISRTNFSSEIYGRKIRGS
jgi:hypothetical protein